jgi:hypothetical protein
MNLSLNRFTCFIIALLFITGIIIFVSCQRELQAPSSDPVRAARIWFSKAFDEELAIGKDGKLIVGNWYPDWRYANTYQINQHIAVVETPLLESFKKVHSFTEDKADARTISSIRKLLIGTQNGRYKAVVMTIIARKEYLAKQHDLSEITPNTIPEDFSGIIYYETFRKQYLRGFYIEKGVVKRAVKKKGKQKINNQRIDPTSTGSTIPITTNCGTCYMHFTSSDVLTSISCPDFPDNCPEEDDEDDFEEDSTGDCLNANNPFNCPCDNGIVLWELCELNDNSGGTNNPPPGNWDQSYPNRIFLDPSFANSKTRCIYDSLKAHSQFFRDLLSSFETVSSNNLTLSVATPPNGDWGITDGYTFTRYRVMISPILDSMGSNISRIVTLVHEIIHARMFYALEKSGNLTFDNAGAPILLLDTAGVPTTIKLDTVPTDKRFQYVLTAYFRHYVSQGYPAEEWTHDLFNTLYFDTHTYQQKLQQLLQQEGNWTSESAIFGITMMGEFGTNWSDSVPLYLSYRGLERTSAFRNFLLNTVPGSDSTEKRATYDARIDLFRLFAKKDCPW